MTISRATINGITGYTQNGSVYLCLSDLSIGLGFSTSSPEGTLVPDWNALSPMLENLGLPVDDFLCSNDSFVPVYVFHCLAEEIGTPVAQRFRSYVDTSVVPRLEQSQNRAEEIPLTSQPPQDVKPEDLSSPASTVGMEQEAQRKDDNLDEWDWHNDEVFVPGGRDHKKHVGILLAMVLVLIIALAVGIDQANKYKEKQKNGESLTQVTVDASDAKDTESTPQTKQPTSNMVSDFDKLSLVIAAEDAIKKELVSPNSAKFPVYTQWDVEKIGDTYYSVTSYVDAKNRLGVEIRQDVNVIIDYNGLSYSILFVTIDDDVYFGS